MLFCLLFKLIILLTVAAMKRPAAASEDEWVSSSGAQPLAIEYTQNAEEEAPNTSKPSPSKKAKAKPKPKQAPKKKPAASVTTKKPSTTEQEDEGEGEEEEEVEEDPEEPADETAKRDYAKARKCARMLKDESIPSDLLDLFKDGAKASKHPRLFKTEFINSVFTKNQILQCRAQKVCHTPSCCGRSFMATKLPRSRQLPGMTSRKSKVCGILPPRIQSRL